MAFARAHLDLAKAEFDEIKGEAARATGLVGAAIGIALLLALFIPIGGMLFLGEWLFGSIGWGLLLGTEALIAVAVTVILVAVRVSGLGFDALVALLLGIVVGVVAGLSLPYRLFLWIGEQLNVPTDPGWWPLYLGLIAGAVLGVLVGLVQARSSWGGATAGRRIGIILLGVIAGGLVGAILGGLIGLAVGLFVAADVRPRAVGMIIVGALGALGGLIGGYRAGKSAGAAVGGLVAGAVAGIVVGGILAIDYGPRIGAALGVAAFFAAWPALELLRLKRQGIDADELKRRFWPQETIDTTKESIEWAKARLPLGPKS